MLKKVLRVITNILLCVLLASGVLTPFAPAKGVYTFPVFLLAAGIFALVVVLLGIAADRKQYPAAWALLIMGIVFTIPLSMDAPPPADIWLKTAGQERFRFALLLLSSLLFAGGMMAVLRTKWALLPAVHKLIILPLLAGVAISLWDFIDLFWVDRKIAGWVNEGKNINDFFVYYNFHAPLRAAGRLLIYLTTGWLCIILWRQLVIKGWVALLLNIFCMAGIIFCSLFVLMGPDFYFPFMVPAVALAGAYWLGVALLNKR